jgi:hypothetical protein
MNPPYAHRARSLGERKGKHLVTVCDGGDPMKTILLVLTLLVCVVQARSGTYYVSTSGNDTTNTGTFDLPFKTIPRAILVAVAGDTIYVRGGVHSYGTTINISKQGTATQKFYLLAFPGERPVLDFSSMPFGSSNRGIKLSASYWYIKGFDIFKAGDNGMFVGGSNNVIEFCSFSENSDTGLQLSSGASYNSVINCDSYYNVDPGQGNADGFSPKLDVGTGNYFYGCRSWQNSDDGFDGYLRPSNDITTTLENCWVFNNGYLKSGLPSVGNGNGFKMGGSDSKTLEHNMILKHCLSFDNRVKGFDQNNNKGSMTLYNCTAYRNGTNYSISQALDSGKTLTLVNCAALGSYGSLGSFAVQQTNSWLPPFAVTDTDFVSIDTTGVRGPRNSDGSLPDVPFMHLARGSALIDAGSDIGLSFNGSAPDLGCFESDWPTSVGNPSSMPDLFLLKQNYPNPFNPSTAIGFRVKHLGFVSLKVYDLLGRQLAILMGEKLPPGDYTRTWNAAGFSSGVYMCRLEVQNAVQSKKMLLMK